MKKKMFVPVLLFFLGVFLLTVSAPAQRGPDLIIKLRCPKSAAAGQELGTSIQVWVRNQGDVTAKNFSVDLVLSTDTTIPVKFAVYSPNFSEDVLLQGGREHVNELLPGKTINVKLNGNNKIPGDTPSGLFYLGAVVDPGNVVKESNEQNNTAYCPMKIKGEPGEQQPGRLPDLIVKDIRLLRNCKIEVTIANIGAAGVPAAGYDLNNGAAIQMYRFANPWGGIRLGAVDPTKKLMTPGQSVSWVWFPNAANLNLTPGTHSIKVIVDNNNAVTESNETNNTRTERLTCQQPECQGQGYQGLAYERKPDGSIGPKIPGVKITFVSEDNTITKTVITDGSGFYRIDLCTMRYVVSATHPDFQDYSTAPGFFVVTGSGYQTGNIFLKRK